MHCENIYKLYSFCFMPTCFGHPYWPSSGHTLQYQEYTIVWLHYGVHHHPDNGILNQFYPFYLGSRDLHFYSILQQQNLDVITALMFLNCRGGKRETEGYVLMINMWMVLIIKKCTKEIVYTVLQFSVLWSYRKNAGWKVDHEKFRVDLVEGC